MKGGCGAASPCDPLARHDNSYLILNWQSSAIELCLIVMNSLNIYLNYPVFSVALTAAVIGGAIVALIRKWVALHLLTSHHEVAFPIFLQSASFTQFYWLLSAQWC